LPHLKPKAVVFASAAGVVLIASRPMSPNHVVDQKIRLAKGAEMEVLQQMSSQPGYIKKIYVPPTKGVIAKNRYANVLPRRTCLSQGCRDERFL
jgi:hypothetical protein